MKITIEELIKREVDLAGKELSIAKYTIMANDLDKAISLLKTDYADTASGLSDISLILESIIESLKL